MLLKFLVGNRPETVMGKVLGSVVALGFIAGVVVGLGVFVPPGSSRIAVVTVYASACGIGGLGVGALLGILLAAVSSELRDRLAWILAMEVAGMSGVEQQTRALEAIHVVDAGLGAMVVDLRYKAVKRLAADRLERDQLRRMPASIKDLLVTGGCRLSSGEPQTK